jgi:hypothetical protein
VVPVTGGKVTVTDIPEQRAREHDVVNATERQAVFVEIEMKGQ